MNRRSAVPILTSTAALAALAALAGACVDDALGVGDPTLDDRAAEISNGAASPSNTVENAVVRVLRGGGYCTGTLIAPDKVITAAHCGWWGTPTNADGQWHRDATPVTIAFGNQSACGAPLGAVTTVPADYFAMPMRTSDPAEPVQDIALVQLRSMVPSEVAVPRAIRYTRPSPLAATTTIAEAGFGNCRNRQNYAAGNGYEDWTTASDLKVNWMRFDGPAIEAGDSGGPLLYGGITGPVMGVLGWWDPSGVTTFGAGDASHPNISTWLNQRLGEYLSAPVDYGWAWVDNATASSTPPASMSRNSAGRTNTVARLGAGSYRVTFPGVARSAGGNVQVVAHGDDAVSCKLATVDSAGDDLRAAVRCYGATGLAADSKFFVSYMRERQVIAGSGAGAEPGMAYVSTSGVAVRDQWTSNGRGVALARPATGQYTVTLPGQSSTSASTVHVTALGADAARCKVAGWSIVSSGTAIAIDVRCFGATGAAVNSDFHLAYDKARTAHAGAGGHAWADNATAAAYTPSAGFRYHTAGQVITAGRNATAQSYFVDFPGLTTQGTPLVTAFGTDASHCKVVGWGSDVASGTGTRVRVRCWSSAGSQVQTRFDVSWLRR